MNIMGSQGDSEITTKGNFTIETTTTNQNILLKNTGSNGLVNITSTRDLTIVNNKPIANTGALIVNGGVYIKKDAYVGQNLNILGNLNLLGNNTKINSQKVIIDDPLITLGLGETDNTAYSGFVSRYKNASNVYKLTGLVKNQGLNEYHLLDGINILGTDDTEPLINGTGSFTDAISSNNTPKKEYHSNFTTRKLTAFI